MNDEHTFNEDGSDEEAIHLENELLRLKMQAELGAHFGTMPGSPDLPPEIEKQFLEHIMAFHKHHDEHPPVAIREVLGHPTFRPSSGMSEEELEAALDEALELLYKAQIRVDFLADYPAAVRYDFITGELLDEETDPPMGPDTYVCFIYEEFHPNHDYDQRQRTEEFMNGFFSGTFPERGCLSDSLITESGTPVSHERAQELLDRFHGMFEAIKDWDYRVKATSAQSDDEVAEGASRMGFTEGLVKYTVLHHDGSEGEIVGPFKLYMECCYGCWEVIHFYMHGFSWN